jgi:hypothetical protein
MGADENASCPRCGSRNLERLVSRFALGRSEEDRLERLADPSTLAGVDENDPKSMARFMKRMGKELGEEAGEDLDQAIEEMEAGASGEPGEGNEGPSDTSDSQEPEASQEPGG